MIMVEWQSHDGGLVITIDMQSDDSSKKMMDFQEQSRGNIMMVAK